MQYMFYRKKHCNIPVPYVLLNPCFWDILSPVPIEDNNVMWKPGIYMHGDNLCCNRPFWLVHVHCMVESSTLTKIKSYHLHDISLRHGYKFINLWLNFNIQPNPFPLSCTTDSMSTFLYVIKG